MSERLAPRRQEVTNESQIDLTPMLDVVFIMLIFFIVTSSFVKEPGATAGTLLEVGDAAREAGVKQVNWPAEEK